MADDDLRSTFTSWATALRVRGILGESERWLPPDANARLLNTPNRSHSKTNTCRLLQGHLVILGSHAFPAKHSRSHFTKDIDFARRTWRRASKRSSFLNIFKTYTHINVNEPCQGGQYRASGTYTHYPWESETWFTVYDTRANPMFLRSCSSIRATRKESVSQGRHSDSDKTPFAKNVRWYE